MRADCVRFHGLETAWHKLLRYDLALISATLDFVNTLFSAISLWQSWEGATDHKGRTSQRPSLQMNPGSAQSCPARLS